MFRIKIVNFYVFSSIVLTGFMASAHAAIDKNLTAEEIQTIAKEAYIYGYPMADNYRVMHSYFINKESGQYKAPFNEIKSEARVYTHEDTAVQTPNSDTPYSFVGLDLRAEPIILTLPKIEKERYYNIQFVDLYTHNFNYVGSRPTGNDGGTFLVTTDSWSGDVPKGIDHVIRSETELTLAIYRTQLFEPRDLKNVEAIQAKYTVQTLSEFTNTKAPSVVVSHFIAPAVNVETLQKSLAVFGQLNFLMQFSPVHESEIELRTRFAKIGISAGKIFNPADYTSEQLGLFGAGVKDAWEEFMALKAKADKGEIGSSDVFGTREHLQNNYLYRMAGAVLGIYGNTEAEAIYPTYYVDSNGVKLHGSDNYELYFAADELPPVNAFWSLTMYKLPESLLIENELNRYLINSPMLEQFIRDEKGGITLYLQNESPGKDKEANWLPTPTGYFSSVLRLYWPSERALNGQWIQPELKNVTK